MRVCGGDGVSKDMGAGAYDWTPCSDATGLGRGDREWAEEKQTDGWISVCEG